MSQRKPNQPGPRRSEKAHAREAGAAVSGAISPHWSIGNPLFASDAVCPLMPVWPWGGHRGWAYDLVRFMRPGVICELGVHWGTSLFAFAQAVKDDAITAKLIGVDTWAGDGHTGPYGPDVLQAVRKIASEYFPALSFELHQMTFDEALPNVADGSVDLLHIDGFHTYDAVKHDFDSWLPKLAPEGIVLLHDVADETGYGSAAYWKELRQIYDGFHFTHSWGLGVVFPKGSRWLSLMREQGIEDKVQLYTYRAELERTKIELHDTGKLAVERMAAIEEMGRVIAGQSRSAWGLDYNIERLQQNLDAANALAVERMSAIQEMGDKIFALQEHERRAELLDVELRAAASLAAERLAAIEDMGRRIYVLQEEMGAKTHENGKLAVELGEARRDLDSAGGLARERLAAIESMGRELFELEQRERAALASAAELRGKLAFAESEFNASSALAIERLAVMDDMGRTIHARDLVIEERSKANEALRVRLEEAEALLAGETAKAETLTKELTEKRAMIEQLNKSVEDLRADVELIAMRLEHLERLEIEREDAAERDGDSGSSSGRRSSSGPEIAPPKRRRTAK